MEAATAVPNLRRVPSSGAARLYWAAAPRTLGTAERHEAGSQIPCISRAALHRAAAGGNGYQRRLLFHGMPISLENPARPGRSGAEVAPHPFSRTIRGTPCLEPQVCIVLGCHAHLIGTGTEAFTGTAPRLNVFVKVRVVYVPVTAERQELFRHRVANSNLALELSGRSFQGLGNRSKITAREGNLLLRNARSAR
jgi:hypothetical protein